MHWKILVILAVLTSTIIMCLVGKLVLFKETMISEKNDEKNDEILGKFLIGDTKKINIILTKEKFDSLIVHEDMVLYYFPDVCPSYDMDIFLVVEDDNSEKYYVPEKNSLILINKEHKWTNSFDKYMLWKK